MSEDKKQPPEGPKQPQNSDLDLASRPADNQSMHQPTDNQNPPPPTGPRFDYIPNPNSLDEKELKTAQTFIMVGSIAGLVSILLMSLLISIVGVVCGIIGYRKLKVLINRKKPISEVAQRLKRSAYISIGVGCLAVVTNIVIMAFMLPNIITMLESGDLGSLTGEIASTPNSTWG